MADTSTPRQLPEAVAAKYFLKPGFAAGTYYFRAARVELDKISVEKADEIVAGGFDILVLKKPAPAKEEKK